MKQFFNPSKVELKNILKRPTLDLVDLREKVQEIFNSVTLKGDVALFDYTRKFDKLDISKLKVDNDSIKNASETCSDVLLKAIEVAKNNIYTFHKAQEIPTLEVQINNGILLGQKSIPIDRVGIYIPAGTAPLLSTIMMLAIPAKIAGCKEIVLCSPPTNDGQINDSMMALASILNIDEVYAIGGAQAIAAMAIGTETIKPVNKIFGPGNQYVTAAKEIALSYGVAMDLPAGPSELLVYADETSIPAFIASDLLSQAEHGIDSQVVLVSNSQQISENVFSEIDLQLQTLPRKSIAEKSLENSISIIVNNQTDAIEVINDYAPEHLILSGNNAEAILPLISNAGSVFLGNYCPESAGDYASGTNHTLPTNGWAKSFSGVNLDAFLKKITYQKISKEGLQSIAQSVTTLAREEQLEAHARAIDIRFQSSQNETNV